MYIYIYIMRDKIEQQKKHWYDHTVCEDLNRLLNYKRKGRRDNGRP